LFGVVVVDDDKFPLCADVDDDAFPLAAVADDYGEFSMFAADDGCGDDDDNGSLCYSLDSDVAGEDEVDELSVFSRDSVASGDLGNDSALPVIESSCSAVTLPTVEASCSASQLHRSLHIAKMKDEACLLQKVFLNCCAVCVYVGVLI
jgi:hypothetical protein